MFLVMVTCDHSIYTIDHSDFTDCSFMEFFIILKGLKSSKLL